MNWGAYIWGVNNGHVVETSLGYFINPLITVALGVVLLHERLRPMQWAAVALGALAVLILSVDYGRPPWLALLLAVSFATYGLIKKRSRATAPEGLLVEAAVLTVPALAVLGVLAGDRRGDVGRQPRDAGPPAPPRRGRAGDRDPAALLRGRGDTAAAVHAGAAPVPRPGHAVRHRGAGAPRADAAALLGGFILCGWRSPSSPSTPLRRRRACPACSPSPRSRMSPSRSPPGLRHLAEHQPVVRAEALALVQAHRAGVRLDDGDRPVRDPAACAARRGTRPSARVPTPAPRAPAATASNSTSPIWAPRSQVAPGSWTRSIAYPAGDASRRGRRRTACPSRPCSQARYSA